MVMTLFFHKLEGCGQFSGFHNFVYMDLGLNSTTFNSDSDSTAKVVRLPDIIEIFFIRLMSSVFSWRARKSYENW